MVTIITMCVISPDEKLVMPSSMSGAAPDREYINRRLTIGSGEKEDDDDTVREKDYQRRCEKRKQSRVHSSCLCMSEGNAGHM